MKNTMFLLSLLFSVFIISAQNDDFVKVEQGHFVINHQPYKYLGTNFWYAMNLGGYNPERLIRELDSLKSIGLTNLRIVAASEGPDTELYRVTPSLQVAPGVYEDSLWVGLDFVLSEMRKRDLKAVVCLANFWPWTGGFGQYLLWSGLEGSIPYPPPHPRGSWDRYQRFVSKFYKNPVAMGLFEQSVNRVVTRVNSITGVAYAEDPTIMSWELCNEPRGMHRRRAFNKWIKKTSEYIKSLDNNHLVTIGSEGSTPVPRYAGLNFRKDHSYSSIDYCTMHIWIENFGWYDPEKADKTFESSLKKALGYITLHVDWAKEIGKPIVLEEFGIARDNRSYDPFSNITYRDKYYKAIFEHSVSLMEAGEPLDGVNFWAWAGEAKPNLPYGSIWSNGDPLIGDPPHEGQGWYSIYDTDTTTIEIFKKYVDKIESITRSK